MRTEVLKGIPPQSNPFHYDAFNMGTQVASNCIIMHDSHNDQKTRSIIVINTDTGERMRVYLVEEKTPGVCPECNTQGGGNCPTCDRSI